VLVSLCDVLLRWLLALVALRARSIEFKELHAIQCSCAPDVTRPASAWRTRLNLARIQRDRRPTVG
jgi:hypothetical protein